MSIPLPDLDSRRWNDLVDQGIASIVRNAPEWTDHNFHDPGVTLLELFAWFVEAGVFRSNRVPDAHLRKFLALAGVTPRPPKPGQVILEASIPTGGGFRLPAGAILRSEILGPGPGGPLARTVRSVPFETAAETDIVDARLVSVHVFNGLRFNDGTALLTEGLSVAALGPDPDAASSPALYLGFDRPLPVGKAVSLWFDVRGGRDDERGAAEAEARSARERCAPPESPCPPNSGPTPESEELDELTTHHSARIAWEVRTLAGWQPLDAAAAEVRDETHAMTWSGFVRLRTPVAMAGLSLPADDTDRFYVRARLTSGLLDRAPVLRSIAMNAIQASQQVPLWQEHALAPGHTGSAALTLGQDAHLRLSFDASGSISHIEDGSQGDPSGMVLGYAPATPVLPERLRITLVRIAQGSGRPLQTVDLLPDRLLGSVAGVSDCPPACPPFRVVQPTLRMWSTGADGAHALRVRPDLDASGALDPHVVVDAVRGTGAFGDGRKGAAPSPDRHVVGRYAVTLATAGGVAGDAPWRLGDDPMNGVLLGASQAEAANAVFRNRWPSRGAGEAETLGAAAARAARSLWAHERLVSFAEDAGVDTLDALDRQRVLELSAPPRASTNLDFERLALSVPGTRVARARAWVGIDPRVGCARFPGTVSVVVVPWLPAGQPMPSRGLLRQVRRYLDRRRVIGTRLVVVGPSYVDVTVDAVIRALPSAVPERLERTLRDRLHLFFDPLRGGDAGRGWPFGRDVYANDVLRVLDRVEGVDHVLSLRLRSGGDDAECSNVCVGRTSLVTSGPHQIRVLGR